MHQCSNSPNTCSKETTTKYNADEVVAIADEVVAQGNQGILAE